MDADPALDAQGSVIFSGLENNEIDEESDKYGRDIVSKPERETSQMDADMWKLLPDHVIERVLPWLPVPSIFRSQLVCKSWNSMINSSLFLHYYSEAYFSVDREPWFLVFSKKHENLGLAYDPSENRWINLSFSFLPTQSRALATAEGLICMIPKASNINVLYICNPISKLWKVLPRPPGLLKFFFLVAGLVVEKMKRSFKVVLAGSELVSGDIDQFVLTAEVYDSETNCWTRSRSFLVEAPIFPWRAISHGILYCVIGQAPWNIIGFNVHNGSWFRISAPMPAFLTSVNLMDHKGRLILIGGMGNYGITTEIGMWELNEANEEWKKVGGLPKEFCDGFLMSLSRRFACVGHGNLIYFSSKKYPKMLVYDLSSQSSNWLQCCSELADPHLHIFNSFCFQPHLNMWRF